jgi:hypothetical protein
MAKVAKAGRCQRCGDMLHGPRFLNSMTKLKAGFVDHYVCTDCLSVEEMAEIGQHRVRPSGGSRGRSRALVLQP